ncbi:MAG: OB-fold nucleic acid binding domain-containing protein, partial [Candidatus Bathyarchaeota archaeon]
DKIIDVKEGQGPFTIEATILTAPILREVTTSKREKVKVASFTVADDTGRMSVSLWRQLAEFAKELSPSTRILLKNIHAKRGFAEQLELSSRTTTRIEVLPDS